MQKMQIHANVLNREMPVHHHPSVTCQASREAANRAQHLQVHLCEAQAPICLALLCRDSNGEAAFIPGWQSCNGSPAQMWEFEDGMLYNAFTDMCVTEEPLCLVDYNLFNSDITASTR